MMMATATKGKRPLRHLTATDKIDAIQRIHDGESKASVARDIGVPESTLRGWCKNEEKLRYMSRQSVENAEKLSSEATAAALTAAAAAELFNGPPEKRLKLDSSMFGNGKLKYDDSLYHRSARGGPMNGLDLSGGEKSLGVSGGEIIMNGLHGADFSSFAKTAAEISALSKSKEMNLKGYGADLSKHGDHPTKADLSMAAISPLTSLSHLSGMSGLAQSPLALSFNEIATNLNLIAHINSNHNLATMSNLGGLNSAAAQSLRNARPKGNTSQSPRGGSLPENGEKAPTLTVRNLAKLQQKTSGDLSNGRDPNAPVDEALWYWLKSQQAMLGLNNLYAMPRASSPQQSSSPPQQHQVQQHHPSTQTPTPPIVSTPQPTPPSSAPSLTPEDTKNSSWFWQWYKTFGTSLLPGEKQHQQQNAINNNTINQQNNNAKAASAYENILYSQLTKGSTDTINNNAQPIDLNISGVNGTSTDIPKPEDLSNHNNHHHHQQHHHNNHGGGGANEDRSRYNPSPSTSAKSEQQKHDDDDPEDENDQDPEQDHDLDHDHDPDHDQDHDHDDDLDDDEHDTEKEHEQRTRGETAEPTVDDQLQQQKQQQQQEQDACDQKVVNGKVKDVLDSILYNSSNSNDRSSTPSNHRRSVSPTGSIHNHSSSNNNSNQEAPIIATTAANNNIADAVTNGTAISTTGGATAVVAVPPVATTTTDETKSEASEEDSSSSPAAVVAVDIKSSSEALEYGEKFLKWLEACSDPNVTTVQVMQFKYLLNSIKHAAERQTTVAGAEERTRIRRRK